MQRLLAAVGGVILLAVALMVSLVVFAVLAAIVLLVGLVLWWKTRDLRRQMREQPPGGRVFEGEIVREPAVAMPGIAQRQESPSFSLSPDGRE